MPSQDFQDNQKFAAAFDGEEFRRQGHQVIDLLADYLQQCQNPQDAVLPAGSPAEVLSRWSTDFSQPHPDFLPLLQQVMADSSHLHNPHYVGHQVSAPLPQAALADAVGALWNNSSVVYEMGPAGTAMERICLKWMADKIGFDVNQADGVLTSGGTLGNLTGLLAARQAKADFDVWNEGLDSQHPLAVLVSEQAHYSVKRALQIMGMGEKGAILVPSGPDFKMDVAQLEQKYEEAVAQGFHVFAVVACSCSTATGSYDDLPPIADFCEEKNLWLHVDGAHGASALLSAQYKHYLQGCERADSVVWDAHKMMLMPTLITGVVFRQGHHSYETFSQKAAYILSRTDADNWYDMGMRTMECSKGMMALKLYTALKTKGESFFADYIDYTYDLTRWFAQQLEASPDFELPVFPDCNVICFRYTGKAGDLNAIQEQIREAVCRQDGFYLVKTTLNDQLYLRCTIINPLTRQEHLSELMACLRRAAARL